MRKGAPLYFAMPLLMRCYAGRWRQFNGFPGDCYVRQTWAQALNTNLSRINAWIAAKLNVFDLTRTVEVVNPNNISQRQS